MWCCAVLVLVVRRYPMAAALELSRQLLCCVSSVLLYARYLYSFLRLVPSPCSHPAEDWTPKKLEVEVPMPEELHIEQLRSNGAQPGEQLQPEEPAAAAAGAAAPAAAAAAPEPDPMIVAQLVTMGFSENGSKRAGWFVRSGYRFE
jgi:hypothetical protein